MAILNNKLKTTLADLFKIERAMKIISKKSDGATSYDLTKIRQAFKPLITEYEAWRKERVDKYKEGYEKFNDKHPEYAELKALYEQSVEKFDEKKFIELVKQLPSFCQGYKDLEAELVVEIEKPIEISYKKFPVALVIGDDKKAGMTFTEAEHNLVQKDSTVLEHVMWLFDESKPKGKK